LSKSAKTTKPGDLSQAVGLWGSSDAVRLLHGQPPAARLVPRILDTLLLVPIESVPHTFCVLFSDRNRSHCPLPCGFSPLAVLPFTRR